jgi:hypothetical protein
MFDDPGDPRTGNATRHSPHEAPGLLRCLALNPANRFARFASSQL